MGVAASAGQVPAAPEYLPVWVEDDGSESESMSGVHVGAAIDKRGGSAWDGGLGGDGGFDEEDDTDNAVNRTFEDGKQNAEVAKSRHYRGLKRWGALGVPYRKRHDLFFTLMDMRWIWLMSTAAVLYLALSLLFALFYYFLMDGEVVLDPDVAGVIQDLRDSGNEVGEESVLNLWGSASDLGSENGFVIAYVFSLYNILSLGFGVYLPLTTRAYTFAIFEIFVGILLNLLVFGVVFQKFSLPKSSFILSEVCCMYTRNGVDTLVFRVGNSRGSVVYNVKVRVVLMRTMRSEEGEGHLDFVELEVFNPPFFFGSWNVTHVVDARSPLCGQTRKELKLCDAAICVSVEGTDTVLHHDIFIAGRFDLSEHVRFGHKFVNVIEQVPVGSEQRNSCSLYGLVFGVPEITVDFQRYNETYLFNTEGDGEMSLAAELRREVEDEEELLKVDDEDALSDITDLISERESDAFSTASGIRAQSRSVAAGGTLAKGNAVVRRMPPIRRNRVAKYTDDVPIGDRQMSDAVRSTIARQHDLTASLGPGSRTPPLLKGDVDLNQLADMLYRRVAQLVVGNADAGAAGADDANDRAVVPPKARPPPPPSDSGVVDEYQFGAPKSPKPPPPPSDAGVLE